MLVEAVKSGLRQLVCPLLLIGRSQSGVPVEDVRSLWFAIVAAAVVGCG
jgi:hypothetical protein